MISDLRVAYGLKINLKKQIILVILFKNLYFKETSNFQILEVIFEDPYMLGPELHLSRFFLAMNKIGSTEIALISFN